MKLHRRDLASTKGDARTCTLEYMRMSIDGLIPHVRALGSRSSWRRSQLPPQISREVLNQLNDARLIETRLWGRQGHDGHTTETPVPLIWVTPRSGWFVVADDYTIAGTLDEVLAHREYQGDCEPEFKLSQPGQNLLHKAKGRLARLSENVAAQIIATVAVLAIVGIAIWKWPWIKEFLS